MVALYYQIPAKKSSDFTNITFSFSFNDAIFFCCWCGNGKETKSTVDTHDAFVSFPNNLLIGADEQFCEF